VAKGVTHESYLSFWLFSYLPADQTLVRPLGKTMPTWDHLWFLVYLLVYTLGFALLYRVARFLPRREAVPLPSGLLLVMPALWLVIANLVILVYAPLTHALVNDWGGHLKWIGIFATGVAAARNDAFWDLLRRHRLKFALLALLLLAIQTRVNDPWWSAVSGLYAWATICALCGYAYAWLNRPSRLLSHLNEAVLPIYILHQPVLLFAAYTIFPLHLPVGVEATAIIAATAAGVFAFYELAIRPFAVTRFLFGLRVRTSGQPGLAGAPDPKLS
jgi:peptidoglycan/LPS O-acetylase OafA/YrhL